MKPSRYNEQRRETMADMEDIALKLDEARRNLKDAIENAVRRHETGGEPIEISLNFVEKPDSGTREAMEKHGQLYQEIVDLVESFRLRPEVQESGMSIYKLQAVDSDGDGSVAVNIQYEYAVNPGMRGQPRDGAGGTGELSP